MNLPNTSFRITLSHHEVVFLEYIMWRELRYLRRLHAFHTSNEDYTESCHIYDEIIQVVKLLKYLRKRRLKIYYET